jgi:hypothetical protein
MSARLHNERTRLELSASFGRSRSRQSVCLRALRSSLGRSASGSQSSDIEPSCRGEPFGARTSRPKGPTLRGETSRRADRHRVEGVVRCSLVLRGPVRTEAFGLGNGGSPIGRHAWFQGITGTASGETNGKRVSGAERRTAAREGNALEGATPGAPPARNKAGRGRGGVQGTKRWETERAGYPEEATPGRLAAWVLMRRRGRDLKRGAGRLRPEGGPRRSSSEVETRP